MNTQGGLNYDATRTIIQYVYETGFTTYRVGFAAAISYVFFVVVLVGQRHTSVIVNRRSREA